MKKGLLLPLIIMVMMTISLFPVGISASKTTADSVNFSISDFMASQSNTKLSRDSFTADQVSNYESKGLYSSKTDELLKGLIEDRSTSDLINYVNGKPSIMMMVAGTDPTLDGLISPLGSFTFENAGVTWVHTSVSIDNLEELVDHPNILRMEADKQYHSDLFDKLINPEKIPTSTADSFDNFTEPFYANDIIGASYVQETFGYNGSGTVVNIMDSGIDFGHSALRGALALSSSNQSASFGFGFLSGLTQLYTRDHYLDLGNTAEASKFNPLHSDATGYIDTSGMDNLKFWVPAYDELRTVSDTGFPWMPTMPVPSQFYVGNLAGNDTGYAFGIAMIINGGQFIISPFVQADATGDGSYDTLYIDYRTARLYTAYFNDAYVEYVQGNTLLSPSALFSEAPLNFTLFPAHTNTNNQYLSADFQDHNGLTPDGFVDISLGALSNNYDEFNFTGRVGNGDPLIRGIDQSGLVFSYFSDLGSHGTAVAGEISALPLQYENDGDLYKIGGAAPGTDIIGTQYFSDSQYIYSNLWVTGYEPNFDLEWVFVNDHVANVTSNSWGDPSFAYDDFAYSYDMKSLFLDLISQPGYVTASHPGIMVVFSAGNAGPGYGTISSAPLGGTFLMVGATTAFGWMEEDFIGLFGEDWSNDSQGFDEVVGFSSAGPTITNYPKVDVVNIGAFDLSISPTEPLGNNNVSVTLFSGTSEAAPLTTAVLSLMYQAWSDNQIGNLAPDVAKTIIKSTAVDLGFDAYLQGSGRVNAKEAVHYIVDGSLPSGEDILIASTTDSLDIYGNKVANAFNYLFGTGNTSIAGYTGLAYPTETEDIKDTAVFGGSILPGETKNVTMTVEGSTISTLEAMSFSTFNTQLTPLLTQSQEAEYYRLYDLIDENLIQSGDYFRISAAYEENTIPDRYLSSEFLGGFPLLGLIQHNDTDNDGRVDRNERQLFNLDLSASNIDALFMSSRLIDENTYVMVYDTLYITRNIFNLVPLEYKLSLQSYERVPATELSFNTTSSPFNISINPDINAEPGFYQGFIRINGTSGGSTLVPYTYTIPLQVEDYDTSSSWSEISGDRNQPLENGVYGAVDLGWRFNTGDWRFYDLQLTGATSTANSLGIEIEWTHPDTMIDVYVIDNDGRIILTSDIIYDGAGVFSSKANNPDTMQRLLVDLSAYRTGDTMTGNDLTTGYETFTIALHNVRADSDAIPYDPISVRAAWVTETVDQFASPTPTLSIPGSTTYNGLPVTTDDISFSWSEVTTNPIPDFNTVSQPMDLEIFRGTDFIEEDTLPSSSLDLDTELNADWTKTVYLEKGANLDILLDWEWSNSDFDLIVVPEGSEISYENDILDFQMATFEKPEIGSTTVKTSGYYIIALDWYDGDLTIDQPFVLEFSSKISVLSSTTFNTPSFSTSLVTEGFTNSEYKIVSSYFGWNFNNSYTASFIYDNRGPEPNYTAGIPDRVFGNYVIGTITDAVPFDYTVSYDGTTISSGVDVTGPEDLIIDANLVTSYTEDTIFSFTATDDLGYTTNQEIKVIRLDQIAPQLLTTPQENLEVFKDEPVTFEYEVSDVTGGTYFVKANNVELGSGTWVDGMNTIEVVFPEQGKDITVRVDFIDEAGNSIFDTFTIDVLIPSQGGSNGSDGGFLAFSGIYFMVLIAIPILHKKFR